MASGLRLVWPSLIRPAVCASRFQSTLAKPVEQAKASPSKGFTIKKQTVLVGLSLYKSFEISIV
jgi:hypothetical protein